MFKLEIDLDQFNLYAIITLSIILGLFNLFDVHYFLRISYNLWFCAIYEEPINILDTSLTYGICTTNDLDTVFRHMNNARFLREMDFARILFYSRIGVTRIVRNVGGDVLQTACNVRYRRPIPLFTSFKITTKIIYWDEQSFYLEHQMINLRDGFVLAVCMSQQKFLVVNARQVLRELLKENEPKSPNPPEELLAWLESIRISSDKLRSVENVFTF
ncbi:protein THEM6-like [Onthophagus taurus]|uniref:protein THEM6-like n=1 Tax=Onthophagus taurus TaxID=166361 RepID=UPI000C2002A0|nr:protein THEM6-like [Onthophagus taurus]